MRQLPLTMYEMQQLSRKLTDDGLLIEAGWIGLRMASIPPDAPEIQLTEMRQAFFAGAQHVFTSIMSIMDDDREVTQKDLERMDKIADELSRFIEGFKAKHGIVE